MGLLCYRALFLLVLLRAEEASDVNGGFFVDMVKWEISEIERFGSKRQADSALQSYCCFATSVAESFLPLGR